MGLSRIAEAFGASALVVRRFVVNEAGPVFVEIEGRRAGLVGWLLALLRFDTTTTLRVYATRVELVSASFAGHLREMVPLSRTSRLGCGYLRPFGYLVAALAEAWYGCQLLREDDGLLVGVVQLLLAACLVWLYFYSKSIVLQFRPKSGQGLGIAYKRSVIEGRNIDEKTGRRIIALVQGLARGETARPLASELLFASAPPSPAYEERQSGRNLALVILPCAVVTVAAVAAICWLLPGQSTDRADKSNVVAASCADAPHVTEPPPTAETSSSLPPQPRPPPTSAPKVAMRPVQKGATNTQGAIKAPTVPNVQTKSPPQAEHAPLAPSIGGEHASLRYYISTHTNTWAANRLRLAEELESAEKDRQRLSARISELSARLAGENHAPGSVLHALMGDGDVNAIAVRQLGRDFAADRSEFRRKMREARSAQRELDEAISRNKAEYERAAAHARRRAESALRGVASDAMAARRKMTSLEKSLDALRRPSILGRADKERRQSKARDIEGQLSALRGKYGDGDVQQSDFMIAARTRIEREMNEELKRLERRLQSSDEDVKKRFGDRAQAGMIVDEFEANTTRRLETVLQEKIEDRREGIARADERIVHFVNAAIGLDSLDGDSLKRVRRDLERWVEGVDRRDANRDARKRQ